MGRRISFAVTVSLVLLFSSLAFSNPGEGIFWKVKKSGVESYILGTIHMPELDLSSLDRTVTQAFLKSEVLIVETNPNVPPPEVDYSRYLDGNLPIVARLSLPARIKVEKFLLGLPLSQLEAYTKLLSVPVSPGILVGQLEESMATWSASVHDSFYPPFISSPKHQGQEIFDFRLSNQFARSGRTVLTLDHPQHLTDSYHAHLGLEDLERYILEALPDGSLDQALNAPSFLEVPVEWQNRVATIHSRTQNWAYQKQEIISGYTKDDISRIYKHLNTWDIPMGFELNRAVTLRHKDWIESLSAVLSKHRSFVAIGLNHVSANPEIQFSETIIGMLQSRGFEVEPIKVRARNCHWFLL